MKIICRLMFLLAVVFICGAWKHGSLPAYQWNHLGVGGGGLVSGMSICTDGTKYIRTDAYGWYVWSGSRWTQLNDQAHMPASIFGFWSGSNNNQGASQSNPGGAFEIAAAPSNCNVHYVAWGGRVLVAQSKGGAYTDANFNNGTPLPVTGQNTMTAGLTQRLYSSKMAVDPNNASNVIVGYYNTNSGALTGVVQYTTNGLAGTPSWTTISTASIAGSTTTTNILVGFDGTQQSGGNTQLVYVALDGQQLYVSSTGLSGSWTQTTGGPTTFRNLIIEPCTNGGPCRVWATDGSNAWVYTGGSPGSCPNWSGQASCWFKITAATGWQSLAVDPAQCAGTYCNNIALMGAGSQISLITNGNQANPANITVASVSSQNWGQPVSTAPGEPGWLANAPWVGTWSAAQKAVFDPTDSNGLWIATGNGVLYSNPTAGKGTGNCGGSVGNLCQLFTTKSAGIEELVSLRIMAPNGAPIAGAEDKPVWYLAKTTNYPSTPTTLSQAGTLFGGYDQDYASSPTTFMVGLAGGDPSGSADETQYSTDGGITWYPFNNGFLTTVSSSALSNDTNATNCGGVSGCVQISLPSTTGLSTWTTGCTQPCNGQFIELLNIGAGPNALSTTTSTVVVATSGSPATWPVKVLAPASCNNTGQPCIDLMGSVWSATFTSYPGNWIVYSPSNPLQSYPTGGYDVFNVDGTGCSNTCTKITMNNTAGSLTNNIRACIYGTGTSADGCWRLLNTVNSATHGTADLWSSSSSPGAYTLGGTLQTYMIGGGNITAASSSNIIRVATNGGYPHCSTDGGKTWAQLFGPSFLIGGTITAGDTITLTATASGISGSPVSTAAYTVLNTDTITTIATALATKINAVSAITNAGTTAFATGPVVVMNDPHALVPTWSSSVTGSATETVTIYAANSGNTGWSAASFDSSHQASPDRVQSNVIYLFNYSLGFFKTTNCAQPVFVSGLDSTGWSGNATVSTKIKAVDGESGHVFLIASPIVGLGVNVPSTVNSFLWRSCDGGANWYRMPNVFQPYAVGYGLPAPGQSYRSIYIIGFVDPGGTNTGANSVYGYWRFTVDPNHGVNGACNVGGAFTGSISGTTLSVSSLNKGGYLAAGDVITGSGVAANTSIVSQLTGTTGCTSGSCTFSLTGGAQSVGSEAMVGAPGTWCELATTCNNKSLVADYGTPISWQSGSQATDITGDGASYGYVYAGYGNGGWIWGYFP